MEVSIVAIDKIIPYVRNPRKNEVAVDKVKASIKEFGFRQPIVVTSEYVVVAGHTRLLASKALGLTKLPVHIAEGLTESQIKAYRIADNRVAQDSEWDNELLKLELGELKEADFNLNLTGFDTDELSQLILPTNIEGFTEDDHIPKVYEEEIITKPGYLWVLGDHRLLCADSTNSDSLEQVLSGHLVDMTFTDPPYNVDYSNDLGDKIQNDNLGKEFHSFLQVVCQNVLKVTKGAIYICMGASEIHTIHKAFTEAGGHWSTFIIWAKNHFALGRSDYQRQFEPILYGWREGNNRYWCGDRDKSDVWNIAKPNSNDLHPTMKPVELVMHAIENSSKPGDIVFDPFAGSGSTLIACEKLNRSARLIEIDPKYCDVIVKRWEEFTGKKASLMS